MEDKAIAKEHLVKHVLNFVLVRNSEVIEESRDRGVRPIYDVFKSRKENLKGAFVADKVIGKASAMLLIGGGIKYLYANIISEAALGLLNDNDIEVEYMTRVPAILNRTGDDLCPIEKLSSHTDDVSKLMEDIGIFLDKIQQK